MFTSIDTHFYKHVCLFTSCVYNQWTFTDVFTEGFFLLLLSTDFALLRVPPPPLLLTASFSKIFLNKVFFQVLYCYSVSAIKVPSWPFSFTLWLWPFVKLSVFGVNWSRGSPRMLFSFILSALWMERSALGSGSAGPHSKSTQSFLFQGPFKTQPGVCRRALMDVSHWARNVSFMAASERDESSSSQRKPADNRVKGSVSRPVWRGGAGRLRTGEMKQELVLLS